MTRQTPQALEDKIERDSERAESADKERNLELVLNKDGNESSEP